jgi:hypothetical protein
VSCPGHFLPLGKTQYPLYRRLGGPQGQSGQVRNISPPPAIDPRIFQPVVSVEVKQPKHVAEVVLLQVVFEGHIIWFIVLLLLLCLMQTGTYCTTCTSHMGFLYYSMKFNLCYLYKMRKNTELYCYLCRINSMSCLRHVIPANSNLLPL